jgi:hypothetical protein
MERLALMKFSRRDCQSGKRTTPIGYTGLVTGLETGTARRRQKKMLTVKLMKLAVSLGTAQSTPSGAPAVEIPVTGRFSTKIIEANEVDIHVLRPGELTEVAGLRDDGKSFAFYVADRNKPRPAGFADEVDFYFAAFIENSSGATTESVRF